MYIIICMLKLKHNNPLLKYKLQILTLQKIQNVNLISLKFFYCSSNL